MPIRLRKFIGTIFLLVFVPLYALFAMVLAAAVLPDQPGWVQFLYYLVAGLLWVIPAGAIIYLMGRPSAAKSG